MSENGINPAGNQPIFVSRPTRPYTKKMTAQLQVTRIRLEIFPKEIDHIIWKLTYVERLAPI